MVRVRNLVLAIAAATALTTEVAHALGLGEVRLQSSLNQPLVAEIELLDAKMLAPGEVVPSLASVEEFNRAGIDRQYFLTDLKFTPVLRPDGKSVIRVSSSKPVREPYLNFLVEVLWPSGRLLREYTLLLDPPLYSPETVAAVAPQLPIATVAPTRAPAVSAAPSQVRPSSPVSTAGQAAGGASASTEYKTSSHDTLWEIAERNARSGTVHQTMLAIQDLNPGAFIDGNINRMKSGQVLRLPGAEQINSRTQAEAITQVAEQNATWRQTRTAPRDAARQVDATRRTTAGDAPAQSDSRDNLRLVAPDAGKSTAGSDTGASGDSKALRDRLATTQESLDSSRRENADLKERLDDLQGQLEKLQRLMQLKDDQLAKLQAQLAVDGAANSAELPAAVDAAAPAGQESTTAPEQQAGKADDATRNEVERAANQEAPASAAAPAAQPASKPEVAPKPAPAKPVAATPEEPSLLDEYLGNPMLLGVLGGSALLLLLVGLMALSRRNAMKEAELQEQLLAESENESFSLQPESLQDLHSHSEASLPGTAANFAEVEPIAQTHASAGDALAEADIYIAYGRFNQAAELLRNALNDEPQRSDLRLKLMEVYAELGDRDGFARQEAELREIGGAGGDIERLKLKYPAIAVTAAATAAAAATHVDLDNFDLDDLQFEEQVSAKAVGQDPDDAFDLSLDDLDIDLDSDQASLSSTTPINEATQHDPLSFDDLSLDELAPSTGSNIGTGDEFAGLAEESVPATSLTDDLGDFSFDLEAPEQGVPGTEAQSSVEDFSFDLDESLAPDTATSNAVSTDEDLLSADFDLSLDHEPVAGLQSESLTDQLGDMELDALSSELDEPKMAFPETLDAGLDDAQQEEDDFNFFSDTDEATTKLDLARAYIDMGDAEGARDILDEVLSEGSEQQQQEAREMLAKLA
ncbi:hypothetical protein YO5_15470 [Stutzerimonas stutzeri TS44]|nr:hypothetical protein YO5_15470 [Stutzerimonas stutzeri TS44]